MSRHAKAEHLIPFLEATIASSARFRRVLIVLIFASVLAFCAFWNARPGSWLKSRVQVARTAQNLQASDETETELNNRKLALNQITKALTGNISTEEKASLTREQQRLNEEIQQFSLRLEDLKAYLKDRDAEAAKEWSHINGLTSSTQVEAVREPLERARTDQVLRVHVPVLGISFDVNELALIGGFTFVVVLMWFRFTLWREYYNLCSTFEACGNNIEDLEWCYKYLAMNQVLTVPPTLFKREPRERPWGKIVRLLYLLPVAIQLAIVVTDCLTFRNGWLISKANTVISIAAGFCFLALTALLTYWCFRLSTEIDREWEAVKARLKKHHRCCSNETDAQ